MSTPTTLWEFYTGSGQKLPPIRERAVLYESYGLGSAATYTGTAEQNTALLGQLMQGPPPDTIPGMEDVFAILEQNRGPNSCRDGHLAFEIIRGNRHLLFLSLVD